MQPIGTIKLSNAILLFGVWDVISIPAFHLFFNVAVRAEDAIQLIGYMNTRNMHVMI